MTEAARAHVHLIQGILAPLDESVRTEILSELLGDIANEAGRLSRHLEEARVHNEQRIEEVYEARKILGAQPNETLPVAVMRVLGLNAKVEE